nr:MAG TPA: hypothetical protein [Caudoviricetes sp.]
MTQTKLEYRGASASLYFFIVKHHLKETARHFNPHKNTITIIIKPLSLTNKPNQTNYPKRLNVVLATIASLRSLRGSRNNKFFSFCILLR